MTDTENIHENLDNFKNECPNSPLQITSPKNKKDMAITNFFKTNDNSAKKSTQSDEFEIKRNLLKKLKKKVDIEKEKKLQKKVSFNTFFEVEAELGSE